MPQSSSYQRRRSPSSSSATHSSNQASELIYNVRRQHPQLSSDGGRPNFTNSLHRQQPRKVQNQILASQSKSSQKSAVPITSRSQSLMSRSATAHNYTTPTFASRSHQAPVMTSRSLSRSHEERSATRSIITGSRSSQRFLNSTATPPNSPRKNHTVVANSGQLPNAPPPLSNSYPSQSRNALAASISYQVCLLFISEPWQKRLEKFSFSLKV